MSGPVLPQQGTASLTDILTSLQDWVRAGNSIVDGLGALSPHFTSGQIVASKLVQTGFVRVTGISMVVPGGAMGTLNDSATLAAANSTNAVYTLPTSVGFQPCSMVFANGLVCIPGSAQVVTLFYART
jgi:hypothetical protein